MRTHHPREMPDRRSSYSFRFPAECCRSRRAAAKALLRAALPGSRKRRNDAPARPNLLTRIRQRLLCRIRRGAEPRLPLAQVGHVLRVAFRGDQSPHSGQQQADKYKKHNRPAAYAGSLCFHRIALLPPCRVLRQNGSMPPYISISSIICVNGDSVKFSAHETAKKSAETVQLRKNCRFLSNGSSSFILF